MKKVTIIGLGRMGVAMAMRLIEQGVPVTVYNRTISKAKALAKQGAKVSDTIAGAVQDADVIISCLLDDQAVIETSIGEQGIINAMHAEAVHVGTATILPETATFVAKAHEKANKSYLSAAVLGIPDVALAGQLTTFCAGKQEILSTVAPIINTFTENLIYLGEDPKVSLVMKIAMNYSLATTLELISELYVFAEKSDIDLTYIQKGLHQIYGHPGFQRYIDKIKARNFDEVNFHLVGGMKDVDIFQKAFSEVGAVPRLAHLLKERFVSAKANNLGDKDWSAIYEVIREESGIK